MTNICFINYLNKSTARFVLIPKCFIVGGGKTYSRFYPFLTDIYITPHPQIFGEGVSLFSDKVKSSKLRFVNLVEVSKQVGIYQYQYKIIKPWEDCYWYWVSYH